MNINWITGLHYILRSSQVEMNLMNIHIKIVDFNLYNQGAMCRGSEKTGRAMCHRLTANCRHGHQESTASNTYVQTANLE